MPETADPLAPALQTDPPKGGTPSSEPKGGAFEETIRSLKDLKPEQQDAILNAHKSSLDGAVNGVRQKWEKEELPVVAGQLAREIAQKEVQAYARQTERTSRNREIVTEEFGIKLRSKDGQPSEESNQMKAKIDETCKRLGINADIALSSDEGMRGLMFAAGYKPLAVPVQEEFGPSSGLPMQMRREAAASAAKPADKRDAWDDYNVEAARVVQGAMTAL